MQVCTLLQTDNHASTPPLSFLQAGCPSCRPTNSVKALKPSNDPQFTGAARVPPAKPGSGQCARHAAIDQHMPAAPRTAARLAQQGLRNGTVSVRLTVSPMTTWMSRYQKGKTSLDLNEARDDGVWDGSGISWTICKQSAPRSRQITTPTPHHLYFHRPDALYDANNNILKASSVVHSGIVLAIVNRNN